MPFRYAMLSIANRSKLEKDRTVQHPKIHFLIDGELGLSSYLKDVDIPLWLYELQLIQLIIQK